MFDVDDLEPLTSINCFAASPGLLPATEAASPVLLSVSEVYGGLRITNPGPPFHNAPPAHNRNSLKHHRGLFDAIYPG
jgi:hypothetical protein